MTKIPKVKGRCYICNGPTQHHHYYCDEHYPKHRQRISDQRKLIRQQHEYLEKLRAPVAKQKKSLEKIRRKHCTRKKSKCTGELMACDSCRQFFAFYKKYGW